MLTKEQARSEIDTQERERVFFLSFFLFCLRWENDSRHGGVIIPHVWLQRQEVSHREVDTVTPNCRGRAGCFEAPLGWGIRTRSVLEAPGSAMATAWLRACMRKGLPRTGGWALYSLLR